MPATKRASEETVKTASKTSSKVAAQVEDTPARPVTTARKPSKTALSPGEVTPLALLTPTKPARRRRSGAAKPRKLKGATTTWPFPTGSRP